MRRRDESFKYLRENIRWRRRKRKEKKMSKSGEETSTPFIKLNDYTKRKRLLTFAAARQRRNSSNKSESFSFSFFLFFSVSTCDYTIIRNFFPHFVFERKKKSKEDLANSRKVCSFRNVLYSSPCYFFK